MKIEFNIKSKNRTCPREYISIKEYKKLTPDAIESYRKSKAGCFKIINEESIFELEPVDLTYLGDILLKWFPRIYNNEFLVATRWMVEETRIQIKPLEDDSNRIEIYEWVTKAGLKLDERCTKSIIVDKKEFLTILYEEIVNFNQLHIELTEYSTNYLEDKLKLAKEVVRLLHT